MEQTILPHSLLATPYEHSNPSCEVRHAEQRERTDWLPRVQSNVPSGCLAGSKPTPTARLEEPKQQPEADSARHSKVSESLPLLGCERRWPIAKARRAEATGQNKAASGPPSMHSHASSLRDENLPLY
jgi:hypothetical protein